MTILKPAPVSSRQFSWHGPRRFGDEGEYVGEISSTNGFGRVYDDAADEGLTLVSARTGQEVVFVVDHTERDRDGDVLFWLLRPAVRHARPQNHAAIYRTTIRLYND
jgi:hypothetical protein